MPQPFAKSQITIPSRLYQPGTRGVDLPNLTTDDNGLVVSFTRENWPVDPVDANAYVLFGVIRWIDPFSGAESATPFGWPGGDQINPRTGQPVTVSSFKAYWPERDGIAQRPATVHADVTNSVALNTAITLQGA
jgi:hypothetical protein